MPSLYDEQEEEPGEDATTILENIDGHLLLAQVGVSVGVVYTL